MPATRRELLAGAGVLFAWPFLPKLARAEGRDPRMLTIVLRGALDGLAAVAPVGDPDWVKLRGDKALRARRQDAGAAARLVLRAQSRDAEPASALHRPGRPRSCTRARRPIASARISTGRTCWKAGCPIRAAPTRGWLNRALGGLEPEARVRRDGRAFAVGPVTPLVVRGPTPVMSWTPQRIQPASEDTMARLIDLYHHTDTELARAIEGRMDLVTLARAERSGRDGADRRAAAAARLRRAGARLSSPMRPAPRRNSSRAPTGRASARSPSTAGTRISTKARTQAASRPCSARSTARSRRSRRTWARPGARPW